MKSKLILSAVIAILVSSAQASHEMIPAKPGNKWEYDCYKTVNGVIEHQGRSIAEMNDASSGTAIYEVLSIDAGAQPVCNYKEISRLRSASGAEDDSEVLIRFTNEGIKIISTVTSNSRDEKADEQNYDPALLYYIKDPAVGKSWNVGVMRDSDTKSVVKAKITGKETVTVPAGTFKDCLKVVYSSDDISGTVEVWKKDFNITEGHTRGIYWVADGIGVVKELEVSFTRAEAEGPDGKPVVLEGGSCTVSELKPGYVIN